MLPTVISRQAAAGDSLQVVMADTFECSQPRARTSPQIAIETTSQGSCDCSQGHAYTRLTLLVCLLLISGAFAQYIDAQQLHGMIEDIQAAPVASIVMFTLLFGMAIVLLLPGMALSIGAGAAYGFTTGFVVAWLGTVLGQMGAFILGRYLLRDVIYAYMAKRFPRFAAIDNNLSTQGWKLVLLLRLSPLLPYNLMNYALGVTSISFAVSTLASAAAAVPYICVFAYTGSTSADVYQLLHDGARTLLSPQLLSVVVCLMIMSAVGLFFVCKRVVAKAYIGSMPEEGVSLGVIPATSVAQVHVDP
eukprot:GHRR01001941.1.p1 GENE.GHRR01001941.1~~GHRR01001941.1.p1  ORF type:complete len:304 (+),score=71.64 GHRR01001941.1:346-1257(+)